jgi:DNA-binding CsgD family transcriptional regulator
VVRTKQRRSGNLVARLGRRAVRRLTPSSVEGRVALAQMAAVGAIGLVIAADVEATAVSGRLFGGLVIVIGFALLRALSIGRRLASSTVALDAIGTAVVLAGTGAPQSLLFPLALAGAWWGAHVSRRHTGALYAVAFIVAYGVLVVPDAVRAQVFVLALEDMTIVAIVGVLSDSFVRVDRRAVELSEALDQVPAGAEELALRAGLTRALGVTEVPVDIVLAAARAGLTVVQAELLAYLSMGLTNQEIADATNVSEATVRYRLTRLYRQLEVRGRKAAVARAHELGVQLASAQSPAGQRPCR